MDYRFILCMAIILVSTKVLGLFSRKISMPAVVGALLAGVILGPSFLNWIPTRGETGHFIEYTAEIGVILLMFTAGLGTNLRDLKANMKASFVTALIGVIVPLLGGFACYTLFFHVDVMDNYQQFLKAVFVGVVLTATSVSITVETLRELGKLKGKVGTTILGAAVIDDIMGIVVLTIVTSLQDPDVKPVIVFGKIVAYFVMIFVMLLLFRRCRKTIGIYDRQRRTAILAVAFCFLMAYLSETVFGIADITGAYFAGLMLCSISVAHYVDRRTEIASYLIFSPVFFASVGLKVSIDSITPTLILFAGLLTIVAILTKVIGCGLGAKICSCTNKESLQIGIGMISRGEVALIVAQKGYAAGLVETYLFAPIVIVVIVTTLVTPILLKVFMAEK